SVVVLPTKWRSFSYSVAERRPFHPCSPSHRSQKAVWSHSHLWCCKEFVLSVRRLWQHNPTNVDSIVQARGVASFYVLIACSDGIVVVVSEVAGRGGLTPGTRVHG
ncbi:unnamed protein product, partial [Ectocarpus sp. 6 AP-2014]